MMKKSRGQALLSHKLEARRQAQGVKQLDGRTNLQPCEAGGHGLPHPAAGGGRHLPQDESPGARIDRGTLGRCDTQPVTSRSPPAATPSASWFPVPARAGLSHPDALAPASPFPGMPSPTPLCCIHPQPSPSSMTREESFPDCSCLTCQNPLWLGFTRHLITASAMSPSHLRVLRDLSAAI